MENTKINLISIAETPYEQEIGLQHIKELPEDAGMLFRFNSQRVLSFWMKNTYLPLDIAFIDNTNKIVKIEKMIPLSLRSVLSSKPCIMALEVNSGTLDRLGVKAGDIVKIDESSKTISFEK